MTLKIMSRKAGSRYAGKKLVFFFFCLSLLLLTAQTALSADPLCTEAPPAGYGGSCINITCTNTAGNTPLDELTGDQRTACLNEYLSNNTGKECSTGKCSGEWYRVCCRNKTACTSPNSCEPTETCAADDRLSGTCADGKICCKPKCDPANCRADCTGTFVPDTSRSATGCTDPAKPKCCKPVGGGATTPNQPKTTESQSIPLAQFSPVGEVDIPTLIGLIIKGVLGIVGSLALLMFVYGGFLMLVSQGDTAKIKKGKDTLIWAAAGLVVIFGSYIFVSFILAGLSGNGSN